MKKYLILILAGATFAACSSEPKLLRTEKISDKTEVQKAPVQADKLLTLEISGMTCVMGCGGAIRSALTETGGVASCEFDFKEGRKTNIAKISYDSQKISVEDIRRMLSELNDKQFTLGTGLDESIGDAGAAKAGQSNSDAEKAVVSAKSDEYHMPNLFTLLSRFFMR